MKKRPQNKNKKTTKQVRKIPFLWKNLHQTKEDIFVFWKPLVAVISVYALSYATAVIGLNFVIPQLTSQTTTGVLASEKNPDTITKVADSLSQAVSFVSGDQASTFVQFMLFLVGSLAFIWALRKIRKLDKVKVYQAYYEGTAQLVPAFLLCIILILFLVPISIGTTILSAGIAFASSTTDYLLVYGSFFSLSLLSIWLFAKYWPSFYIITLPSIRPIYALKQAGALTRGHRFNITIQVIGFLILSVIVFVPLLLLFALILPKVTPYWLFILLFIYFGVAHVFMFNIYRGLVDGD